MKISRQITQLIVTHYYKSALVSWLEGIETGLYEKYAANIEAQRSKSVLAWLKTYESTPHPSNLTSIIMDAFTWCYTPQGGPFWHRIHDLWVKDNMSCRLYEDLPHSYLFLTEGEWRWREIINALY